MAKSEEQRQLEERLGTAEIGGSNRVDFMLLVCLVDDNVFGRGDDPKKPAGTAIAAFATESDRQLFIRAKLQEMKIDRLVQLEQEKDDIRKRLQEIDATIKEWS